MTNTDTTHAPGFIGPIDAAEILVDPDNNARHMTGEDIDTLVTSIRRQGQLQPVIVRPLDEELSNGIRYALVAGFRRFAAIETINSKRKNKFLPVLAHVVEDDGSDTVKNLIENMEREDLSSYEICQAVARLAAEGLSADEIAKQCGRKKNWANYNLRHANNLTSEAMKAWARGHEGLNNYAVRDQVARLPREEQLGYLNGTHGVDGKLLTDGGEGGGEDGEGGEGEDTGSQAGTARRPSKKKIEKALNLLGEMKQTAEVKAARRALRFCLGIAETPIDGMEL